LSSSSDVLGTQTSTNELVIEFTPETTMAPKGSGTITLEMPPWYSSSGTDVTMYNPEATDKCSSDCMKITSSGLIETSGTLKIDYV
jgi:hypothetical protein